ncbi:MAG: hypothetical protein LW669_04165 [Sphingobacteriales bacterium]|nr:hypothetical protein [Sphingobacteriales bacterium]
MRANLIILGLMLALVSCTKDPEFPANTSNYEKVSSWSNFFVQNSNANFYERDNAVVLSLGKKAYIIGGNNLPFPENNTWCFNPASRSITTFGTNLFLPVLSGAIGFTVGDNICYGTGVANSGFTNSFFVKNAVEGTINPSWRAFTAAFGSNATFPGAARSNAVTFTVGNNVYVGLGIGQSGYLRDFYCFNTDLKTWKKVADFMGSGRQDAVSFVINDKAYVGTGYNNGYLKDFYEYNQATDTWRKIADLPDNGRDDAVAFSLTGRGYVGLGWNGTTGVLKDFWQYNPASNAWRLNTSLADLGRFGANAWVIDNVPYIGFGSNGISATDEIWKANK